MSPDDPRHGKNAGYMAHRRDGETPCDNCRRAATAAQRAREAAQPIGLSDGRWLPRPGSGGVQVWVPEQYELDLSDAS